MNLFWKRLFGGLENTPKYEDRCKAIVADYKRFIAVEQSDALKEYRELYEKVKSPEFKEKKNVWVNRKYKDTQESRDMHAFNRYNSNYKLRLYYETLESSELAEFLKFKNSPDFRKLGNPKEVKKSAELQRMKRFEKSAAYKNYVRFHESYVVKEYEKLKEKIQMPEFIKANDFWIDARRWEKTDECALERRYFALADSDDIKFYNTVNQKRFDAYKQLEETFHDSFDHASLDTSKWKSGFYYPAQELLTQHSYTNEKQANMAKNILVKQGNLCIDTIRERCKALAWDAKRGFVEHEFDYSSGAIQAHNGIYQQGGVFRVKLRCDGSDGLTHAVWLAGDRKVPRINLCVIRGGKVEMGVYIPSQTHTQYVSTTVTGLNTNEFYVYTLRWTDNALVWSINNLEVFRCTHGIPTEPMYLACNSSIAADQQGATGRLEIDWITVLKNKK